MADILQRLACLPLNELHLDPAIQAGSKAQGSQITVPSNSTSQACFALFDQAVQQGFSAILIDYIIDVQDGTLVKCARDWCQQTVADIQHRVEQADMTQGIQSDLKRIDAAVAALDAFNQISGSASFQLKQAATASQTRPSGAVPDLNLALKLHQILKLVYWYLSQELHVTPAAGNFASLPDWTRRVQLRRERKPTDEPLFLDDVLQSLPGVGAYPFTSSMHALQAVIKAANSRPADNDHDHALHWDMCVALLVYYLCDSGALQPDSPKGQELCSSLCTTLKISRNKLALWIAAPALDDASLVNPSQYPVQTPSSNPGQGVSHEDLAGNAALQSAVKELLARPPANLPTKVIKVLAALRLNHTAMMLHYTQPGPVAPTADGRIDFDDAWTAVQLRLSCGMVAEALAYTHALVSTCKDDQERKALQVELIRGILDAAVYHKAARDDAMASTVVLELCCGHEEEEILVDWLLNAIEQGKAVGILLPMVMAARGKIPEALGAFKRWSDATQAHPQPGKSAKQRYELTDAAINCAAEALPVPLRCLHVDVVSGGARAGGAGELRGPDSLLSHLHLDMEAGQQYMVVSRAEGTNAAQYPTTLASSSLPPKPAATSAQSDSGSVQQGQAVLPSLTDITGVAAGGSAAFVSSFGRLADNNLLLTSVPTQQPWAGEHAQQPASTNGSGTGLFDGHVPPPLGSLFGSRNGNQRNTSQTASQSQMAEGRALFSLSNVPTTNIGQPTGSGFETPVMKRSRPNSWMQQ